MKRLLIALLLISAPAFAQVPNDKAVVDAVFASGQYDLTTHDGQAAFVDAAVLALHKHDAKWGHLKKQPNQTNIHLHAEDAALYLSSTAGQSQAVDFIGDAGGSNPSIVWGVDMPRYSKSDWLDPDEHGGTAPKLPPVCPVCPPAQTIPGYPGDEPFDAVGRVLFADYAEAGQGPNEGMGRWFGRTIYDWIARVMPTLQASIDKHRAEWRAALGLPALP